LLLFLFVFAQSKVELTVDFRPVANIELAQWADLLGRWIQ